MDGPASILRCADCAGQYRITDGIPRLVMPQNEEPFARSCARYDALRLNEGWASEMPGFYQHLPFRDLSGRHPREWRLRAQSFRVVQCWLERTFGQRRVRVLDAGAGSSWMSRCLAERYEVLGVDVNAGPHGLAALPPEERRFLAMQGTLERLPLADGCLDVVIANASFHYTREPQRRFAEAHRVLKPGSWLIVMDSPTYPTQAAVDRAHERTRVYYANMGMSELAEYYTGFTASLFSDMPSFRFQRLRRDLSWGELMKKWIRETLGRSVGARFPIWIGITDGTEGKNG
ncbi:MAG: class I SAM-dependent methyltransferase [Candidatus Latescibacteria bacterium]|nr:class I SAM-dependent methyltransferase [Candidatus Latescibacterota bacterium]